MTSALDVPDTVLQVRSERIGRAIANCRERLRIRLVAAGVRPQDALNLILDAIDEAPSASWSASSSEQVLVRLVDEACSLYAGYRQIPYYKLLAAFERQWSAILPIIKQVALEPLESEAILLDVVRGTRWGDMTPLDGQLIALVDKACASFAMRVGRPYRRTEAIAAYLTSTALPPRPRKKEKARRSRRG
jgi:hypothetical protein